MSEAYLKHEKERRERYINGLLVYIKRIKEEPDDMKCLELFREARRYAEWMKPV